MMQTGFTVHAAVPHMKPCQLHIRQDTSTLLCISGCYDPIMHGAANVIM